MTFLKTPVLTDKRRLYTEEELFDYAPVGVYEEQGHSDGTYYVLLSRASGHQPLLVYMRAGSDVCILEQGRIFRRTTTTFEKVTQFYLTELECSITIGE